MFGITGWHHSKPLKVDVESDLKDCVMHAVSGVPETCTDECRFIAQRILDKFEVVPRDN